MYTATAPASGAAWTLPAEAVGQDTNAVASYGTAATTLADGTPIAAFPLNSDITWHVGTAVTPTSRSPSAGCCAYNLEMVRDGDDVWLGWYANGGTPSTNGTLFRRIHPTLGPVIKAPGAAYCVGYPNCDHIGLWKVGTSKVTKVPRSRYAEDVAISPGPSGRLWIAWSDNIPKIQAVRTGRSGSGMGPGRVLGMPRGTDSVYSVAVNGTTGRGDVVIQVGNGFWHTQSIARLTLRGKPGAWKHGKKRKATFTVTDAGDSVAGAKVKAGSKKCTTKASGRCTIAFPRSTKGKLVVHASGTGYAPAKTTLRVK